MVFLWGEDGDGHSHEGGRDPCRALSGCGLWLALLAFRTSVKAQSGVIYRRASLVYGSVTVP